MSRAVRAEPAALDALAAPGRAQAFALDRAGIALLAAGEAWSSVAPRSVRLSDTYVRVPAPPPPDVRREAAALRRVGQRVLLLDRWVEQVAAALRLADVAVLPTATDRRAPVATGRAVAALRVLRVGPSPATSALRSRLTGLGAAVVDGATAQPDRDDAEPATATRAGDDTTPAGGGGRSAGRRTDATAWHLLEVERLAVRDLRELAAWDGLPGDVRDRVLREVVGRELARLDREVARRTTVAQRRRAAEGADERLLRWVDDVVVDRLRPVVDLHVTPEEVTAGLARRRAGLAWLAEQPDLRLLAFAPSGPGPDGAPTLRVALGDPGTASHVAVLVPGTGSGVAGPGPALADARTLRRALAAGGTDGRTAAVVLELYGAPPDLGHAADVRYGEAAAATLDELVASLRRTADRVTLVGHSYGAFAAGRTVAGGAAPDALVALGAPGLGVDHVDALGLPPGAVHVALAAGDPIALAAAADRLRQALPGGLAEPLAPATTPPTVLGPDPADPAFGARRLPTAPVPVPGTVAQRPTVGHLGYLAAGSATLTAVVGVVLGAAGRTADGEGAMRRRDADRRDADGS